MYKCTEIYKPGNEFGILWSDPVLDINWSVENPIDGQEGYWKISQYPSCCHFLHVMRRYKSEETSKSFWHYRYHEGYAYFLTSIFFILSGYGLFYTLDRRFKDNFTLQKLLKFYYDRFLRIFPLLWIAWLAELLVRHGKISFWIPFGIHGTGHYWFIPALLQCYLISPLIYLGLKKNISILITVLIVVICITNFLFSDRYVSYIFVQLADFIMSKWNGVYFLHILVFALGFLISRFMATAQSIKSRYKNIITIIMFWLGLLCILIFMIFLKHSGQLYPVCRTDLKIVFLLMIGSLCVFALSYHIRNSVFAFLGNISYCVYLFHVSFYLLVSDLVGGQKDSIRELLIVLILLPLFILLCSYMEKFGQYISRKFGA